MKNYVVHNFHNWTYTIDLENGMYSNIITSMHICYIVSISFRKGHARAWILEIWRMHISLDNEETKSNVYRSKVEPTKMVDTMKSFRTEV